MNMNYNNLLEYIVKGLYIFFLILILLTLVVSFVSLMVSFFRKNDEKLKLIFKRFFTLAVAAIPVVVTNVWGVTPNAVLNSNNKEFVDEPSQAITDTSENVILKDTLPINSIIDYSNLEVVIAIDQSISMEKYSDSDKIALDAACSFVDLCKNADNCIVSVISFANDVRTICKNKNAKEDSVEIKNNIRDIKYNLNYTNIAKALETANNILKDNDIVNSKEIILLISDGKIDVLSQVEEETLRKSVIENLNNNYYCCPIYTIGLNSNNSDYPVDIDLMQQIASKTDGACKIIETQKNISDINNQEDNIFLFLIDIINKYLGTNIYVSPDIKTVSPLSPVLITSNNILYSSDMNLIVFGNPNIINVTTNSNNQEVVKGNNYIVVNSQLSNECFTVSSTKETQIIYAFVHYFDASIEYSMQQNLLVGEPLTVSGKLISNSVISSDHVAPYLYVLTESDFLAGKKTENKHLLVEKDGTYILPEEYVFSQPGTYYCKIALTINDNFERCSNYVKIKVAEPTVYVSSSEINKDSLTLTVQISNISENESTYSLDNQSLDNFDIKLSTDNNQYKKAELTKAGFEAKLQYFQKDKFDLYTQIDLKDSVNVLCGKAEYSKNFVTKNNQINNISPYLIGNNHLKETMWFRLFNNNIYEIPLDNFFNDDSSDYKIAIKSKTYGTDIQFNEKYNALTITSNDIGANQVVVYAVDIENPNMKSEELTINFDIIFYLGKLNITISLGFITSFIAITLNRRITYGKLQLTILLEGESIDATFKGKNMKVSKLIKNHKLKKHFKKIKIKRLSNKTLDIKQKGSKNLIDPSINSFDTGFFVQGTNGYRLLIRERKE